MTDTLALVPAGIDTYRQPVVYMNEDCHISRSEGFAAQTRVRIDLEDRWIIATLNVVGRGAWLDVDQAALSASAWAALGARAGDKGAFSHPEPPVSASMIRSKAYGDRLDQAGFAAIVRDTLDSRLSDLDLAAFVTACAGDRLDEAETLALTRAMQGAGQTLDWGERTILDKHCVGGLPGNRTTPIVVAIVAAAGHLIPKTSSRAITSPAGTADTMEVMAPVALDAAALRRVVEAEGGCIVWGGGLALSPADDHFIRVERPLDFDSTGQLVASVLSKKAAAGATHVLIDMPVGPTAKVRSPGAAEVLGARLSSVSNALGLNLALHISDGVTPVGRGIGPALEAIDVLAVLRRVPDAPVDLRERALDLAGHLLDLTKELDCRLPEVPDVHLVMNNYATHKTPKVKAWLARRPHWHVHFTPTSASWLNQIERWFVELTRKQIQRGVYQSVAELEADIMAFIEAHNDNPKPYKWVKSADEILASVKRVCLKTMNRTSNPGD